MTLDEKIRNRLNATSASPSFATRYQLRDALRNVLNLAESIDELTSSPCDGHGEADCGHCCAGDIRNTIARQLGIEEGQ